MTFIFGRKNYIALYRGYLNELGKKSRFEYQGGVNVLRRPGFCRNRPNARNLVLDIPRSSAQRSRILFYLAPTLLN